MQDHSISRPLTAYRPTLSPHVLKPAQKRSALFGQTPRPGLTRAQLRDIVIEQLG